jgi:hypothetical protein
MRTTRPENVAFRRGTTGLDRDFDEARDEFRDGVWHNAGAMISGIGTGVMWVLSGCVARAVTHAASVGWFEQRVRRLGECRPRLLVGRPLPKVDDTAV